MNILIDKLSAEIPNWKNVILSIEEEDSNGSRSLRDGEREVFLKLKEFWMYNDFNPNHAKDLINELKKHEPYHAPKWNELGEFRRICVQYYTKDREVYESFQKCLGGKTSFKKGVNHNVQSEWESLTQGLEDLMTPEKLGELLTSQEADYSSIFESADENEYSDIEPEESTKTFLSVQEIGDVIRKNSGLNVNIYHGNLWELEYDWFSKFYNNKFHDLFEIQILVTKSSFWNAKSGFAIVRSKNNQKNSQFLVFFDKSRTSFQSIFCLGYDDTSSWNILDGYFRHPFRIKFFFRRADGLITNENITEFDLASDVESLLSQILDKWNSNKH